MSDGDDVLAMLQTILMRPGQPVPHRVGDGLRLLAKHRSEVLTRELGPRLGTTVLRGPFAGLVFGAGSTEGSYLPKVLGTYESELHAVVSSAVDGGYAQVIDIGCAEGYYAVGLARLLSGIPVHAFDIDPASRARCAAMAQANRVAERVTVRERFEPGSCPRDRRTLVVCDVEGAECEVLGPPGPWVQTDLLVEVHDVFAPGTGEKLTRSFETTHAVRRIPSGARVLPDLPELHDLDHLDQLLAVWEWRLRDNYWLWMEARGSSSVR
jgi:hypothetical protein